MPIIFGLHIVFAILCAVHAVRTGRNLFWLFILFSFPFLGSLVYFITEMLPEQRARRAIGQASEAVRNALDPARELHDAQSAVELSPTAANRARLAQALLARGETAAAIEHFQAALQGPLANDASLLYGLAQAHFANNDMTAARATLERLRGARFSSQDTHLLYARTLAASGDGVNARQEYEQLIGYYAGPEAKCRYAAWLAGEDDNNRARELYQQVLNEAKHSPRHARQMHREWIRQAEEALR